MNADGVNRFAKQPSRKLLLLLLSASFYTSRAPAQKQVSSFQTITEQRLQAARDGKRTAWNSFVPLAVFVFDESGNRLTVDEWWKDESVQCNGGRCAPHDFNVRVQTALASVTYFLDEHATSDAHMTRCVDTFVKKGEKWTLLTVSRAEVVNGGKTRVPVAPAVLGALAGVYSDKAGHQYEVSLEASSLTGRVLPDGEPQRLVAQSDNDFSSVGYATSLHFETTDASSTRTLTFTTGDSVKTFTKVK